MENPVQRTSNTIPTDFKSPVSGRKFSASGPKSQSGRLRSRSNAVKHGMCATDEVILSCLTRHERSIYQTLRDNFRHYYGPVTEEEKLLVDRIALEHFRLLRLYRIEHLTYRRTKHADKVRDSIVPFIDRFSRYESATNRQLRVLHNNLCHLYFQRGDYRPNFMIRKE